ncbi:MAG: PSD1 and planctomycete cytochrome C domain-containing protein [Chthoniobacteraceae bacterium]
MRVLAALCIASLSAGVAAEPVDFNRDIRPILATKCYACHGPDEDKRKADLRLDTRAGATRDLGGYAAVAPGKPEASELWHRIISTDKDEVMPPPESPKQLTAQERELFRRWIGEGAEYREHWSFLPVRAAMPPTLKNADGVRNGIDAFIRREFEARGIAPAPEAGRGVLIRRVSLDLIGLPPTPEEVAQFVADQEAGAYERVVDRLLASPHFGERWGRHWLDLARYADSDGFLGDKVRPDAWRFRDWVIDAINRDQPFDEFTIEQLAGDLLPDANSAQLTATGFHRNAARNTEAGVDKEEARFQNLADRVNTTGRVWLGLTIGCAQCHTHKYDPITIRDYYGFYAFFNNTEDRDDPTTKAQTLAETGKDRRETYVHLAGSYTRRGPNVVPVGLSALPSMPAPEKGEATRLDLARWLVSPKNPLTSRVAVNLVWSKLFGTGIVSTPDDFGATGESPSHPELLDWLAAEFMRGGWSRKKLIRLIVTSATYRQSSAHRAELTDLDPLNHLLARQNRLRLEAEVLRDAALKTSGLLTTTIGGPSIRPPLPGDVFDVGRSVKWDVSQGAERYRRGLYILTLRSVLYPMLTTFDGPDASEACVRRDRSNTPLQALTLMNDPVFVEAAQALAQRAMREAPADTRLRHLFRLCLTREPGAEELERLLTFQSGQKQRVIAGGMNALKVLGAALPAESSPDAIEAATLVATARVLMNLDEFINRD